MKFVIQRVNSASLKVEGKFVSKIGKGFLVFVGISNSDSKEIADKMVKKLTGMRIFEDENGKTNLSCSDVNGEILLVSQFTLYADCKKGNRPSFTKAGDPGLAESLYEYIIAETSKVIPTKTGIFGADMKICLENDGPFTIILDSDEIM